MAATKQKNNSLENAGNITQLKPISYRSLSASFNGLITPG